MAKSGVGASVAVSWLGVIIIVAIVYYVGKRKR